MHDISELECCESQHW